MADKFFLSANSNNPTTNERNTSMKAAYDFMMSNDPATPAQAAVVCVSFVAILCFNLYIACRLSRHGDSKKGAKQ